MSREQVQVFIHSLRVETRLVHRARMPAPSTFFCRDEGLGINLELFGCPRCQDNRGLMPQWRAKR